MHISRLFEITYILLERGTVTARELAERFEVSPRTIYRDVENLSASGIPVYMEKGRNGGIRLLPSFVLDKTVLTSGEKDEILSALQGLAAAGLDESGETGATKSAFKKLAALFGMTGANWIEVDFSGWGWGSAAKVNFERLKTAVIGRRAVAFTYYSSAGGWANTAGLKTGGETTRRVVEPMRLVFRGQSWYLYGWCRLRADYRFFKLSRMQDILLLDEVFDRMPPSRPAEPDIPLIAVETVSVRLRADQSVAFRIYDEYPHECILREEDGSLLVSSDMPYGEWLISYFLTYGPHIEILEPDNLRSEVIETLGAMLGKYTKNKP